MTGCPTRDGPYYSKVDPPGHNHFWVSHPLSSPGQTGNHVDAVRAMAGRRGARQGVGCYRGGPVLYSARYQRCDLHGPKYPFCGTTPKDRPETITAS